MVSIHCVTHDDKLKHYYSQFQKDNFAHINHAMGFAIFKTTGPLQCHSLKQGQLREYPIDLKERKLANLSPLSARKKGSNFEQLTNAEDNPTSRLSKLNLKQGIQTILQRFGKQNDL